VSKKEKGKILDEFTKVNVWHRKAAIRLIRHSARSRVGKKRRLPRQYGVAMVGALRLAWKVADRLCSKRLQPFLPELVKVLRRHGESTMLAEIEVQLCEINPSTIDRLLKLWRLVGRRRPVSTTKPSSLLKSSIPIRTFADWSAWFS